MVRNLVRNILARMIPDRTRTRTACGERNLFQRFVILSQENIFHFQYSNSLVRHYGSLIPSSQVIFGV